MGESLESVFMVSGLSGKRSAAQGFFSRGGGAAGVFCT